MNKYLEQLPVMRLPLVGSHKTALVDGDYDGELFSLYKWRINDQGYIQMVPVYEAIHSEKTGIYLGSSYSRSYLYLHHFVLKPKKGYWVKHVNGDKLDNRSCNLTYITPRDSALTRAKSTIIRSKSGYRGVVKERDAMRWKAQCKSIYLGRYTSPEEAARAYDRFAKLVFKDKAILNFPEEIKDDKLYLQ